MRKNRAILIALAALPNVLTAEIAIKPASAEYTISYGQKKAPIQVVEHFLLDCPNCLRFIVAHFPEIKRHYIDTGWAHWTFHLDPVGLINFQAFFCLSQLSKSQKKAFLALIARELSFRKRKNPVLLMQEIMLRAGKPLPRLHDLHFLEKTAAWDEAMRYLSQKNLPKIFPAFEINGKYSPTFGKPQILSQTLAALIRKNKGEKP